MTKVRVAVIGAGSMGTNHARVYSELDTAELVGIADTDRQSAELVARRYHTAAFSDCHRLLSDEAPDLVSITVPTGRHEDVALEVIESGTHLLVEKPLALSVDAALRVIAAAEAKGVKLTVGHIERFNPAVVEIKQRLRQEQLGRVFQIHARRLSPFPDRIDDVGVILDLATHDIDVMRDLLDAEVERVFAETERKAHKSMEDLVTAVLRFTNGVVGVLDINWLTPTKVRQLTVLGEGGMYLADYLTQDLYWYKNTHKVGSWASLNVFRGPQEGDMIKIRIDKKEPLRAELESFVDAVANDKDPVISGRDGLAAIAVSQMIMASGRSHVPASAAPDRD